MRRLTLVLPILLCLGAFAAEPPFLLEERFDSYPEGSAGESRWEVSHIGFAVQNQALRAEVKDERGIAVLRAAPLGCAMTVEASLTADVACGKEWKTASIGLWLDDGNFWHLALVEGPDAAGSRHHVELSEMLDGVWNAQNETATRLTTVEESGSFPWRYGQTYRMRLSLAREEGRGKLIGEVFEGDVLRYRCVRLLDRRAVEQGWPMVGASSVAASFDDVRVSVAETAPPPPVPAEKTFPPFTSSPFTVGKPGRGTGFFRVEQDGETWWLVDPNGVRTVSIGTDHVRYQGHWCEALGFAPHGKVTEKKYGSAEAWAREATKRLRDWGFNVLGAGNSREARYQGLAHTEFLSFGAAFSSTAALVEKTFWTGWPDVFDPRFERFCEMQARKQCAPLRKDPWLVGYFLDNELEWWGKSHRPWGLAEDTCKLPARAAGKKALVDSLKKSFQNDPAAFHEAFGASIESFDDLLALTELPQPKTDRAKAALDAFIAEAAARYFQITTAAVRRHDPNHLVIGCRFAHDAPDSAWRQAGATCDVVTVNMYPRINLWQEAALGVEEHLRSHFELCHKPVILTEWSFPALDAKDSTGRPLPSRHGAGMRVDTQEQKAACYAIMQRTLFTLPFLIGSHYFMWVDEPALGISSSFPEDSNYGLVSESDEPYPLLTAAAARVNPQLVALHAGEIKAADVASGLVLPATLPGLPREPGDLRFERSADGYRVETGPLLLTKDAPGGAIFDRVALRNEGGNGWVELGSYRSALHITAGGRNAWPHADRVTGVELRGNGAEQLVLEVAVAGDAPFQWAAGYRLSFEAGLPSFRAQGLWVENKGEQAWHLGSYFHFLPSRIGGEAKDDEVGEPDVPNYWLKMSTWRDPALGLSYGVFPSQQDERVRSNFWKEGGSAHPDCWREIKLDLNPGQRWTAAPDETAVTIFGLRAQK